MFQNLKKLIFNQEQANSNMSFDFENIKRMLEDEINKYIKTLEDFNQLKTYWLNQKEKVSVLHLDIINKTIEDIDRNSEELILKIRDLNEEKDEILIKFNHIETKKYMKDALEKISNSNNNRIEKSKIHEYILDSTVEEELNQELDKKIEKTVSTMMIQGESVLKKPILSSTLEDQSINHLKKSVITDVNFSMVYCPKGEFWMGSTNDIGSDDEKRRLKINKAFWIGETQVTQSLWEKVMGWNPSAFKGNLRLPVENITWYDCLVFCNQLSEIEGFGACFRLTNLEKDGNHIKKANVEWLRNANGYRLPTETEWEYAAKAGSKMMYSGSNHVNDIAWFSGNSEKNTHEVKIKKSNAWGLYDMSGNVYEWCMDKKDFHYDQSISTEIENPVLWGNSHGERVVRGGSYESSADDCRCAYRSWRNAESKHSSRGFRLLRNDF